MKTILASEKIYAFLETRGTIDKGEIEDIRNKTKTTTNRMFTIEGGWAGLSGGVSGGFKGFSKRLIDSLGYIVKD